MCLCSPNTAAEASPAGCGRPGLRWGPLITGQRLADPQVGRPGCGDALMGRAAGAKGRTCYLEQSDSLRHKVDGGSQGWRGGQNGAYCLAGAESVLQDEVMAGNGDSGATLSMCLISLKYTLENV